VFDRFKEQHAEKFDFLTFDFSGHGQNPSLPDSFSFETYVQELYDVIQKHRLTEVTLLAHSMGGRIATVFAGRHPKVVQRLVLLDCKLSANVFKPGTDDLVALLKSVPSEYATLDALHATFLKLGYPLRKLERFRDHGTVFQQNDRWHIAVSPRIGYLMREQVLSSPLPWESLGTLMCRVTLFVAASKSIVTQAGLDAMKQVLPSMAVQVVPASNHQTIVDLVRLDV
jgi:pimeloyl-ACP methyl ester carboxylesterase